MSKEESLWMSQAEALMTKEWLDGMERLYLRYGPKIPKKIVKEFVDSLNEKYKHEN